METFSLLQNHNCFPHVVVYKVNPEVGFTCCPPPPFIPWLTIPLTPTLLGRRPVTSIRNLVVSGHLPTGDPSPGHYGYSDVPPWIQPQVLSHILVTGPSPISLPFRKVLPPSSAECGPPQTVFRRCNVVGIPFQPCYQLHLYAII